ncbi:glutamine--fructose-6-phosphate transaminase (isomerizing) [candidate division WOR-3 bacterium]|nr:glutamine--fructose-6-phosphate transaminase (isomerizing) [candidate division WOR-3 bacterium]MCK4526876.1 glutamine--fructose-6-phosphate transaminase (isomerizing) [candidate division WOR-3 bacterium]
MCGIMAYVGDKDLNSVLMAGLWRLEYRGYDSSGVASIMDGELEVRKALGRLMVLQDILSDRPIGGGAGIGHTRWATHGEPSDQNAHPQVDCSGKIAVVHNGIIENHYSLKEELIKNKHIFQSNTDTEVIAHLIEENYNGDLKESVLKSVSKLRGSFAIAVIVSSEPDRIVIYREGSPLIVGLGNNESLAASDIPAIIDHTRRVIIMSDGELAVLRKDSVEFYDKEGKRIEKKEKEIKWSPTSLDKGEYAHYMLKEIYEQPEVIERNIALRIEDGEFNLGESFHFSPHDLAHLTDIVIQACGTSWHAGYIGKYLFEEFARIHTEVDISSEFRYRNPVMGGETLVIAVSQSGETADTLAGLREAKAKFLKVLSIVNVRGSTIARESESTVYINAGPEIGVASTKAYTSQILQLYLMALYLSKLRWALEASSIDEKLKGLIEIPKKMRTILNKADSIKQIAEKFKDSRDFMFIGRGINYPSALEGALKLKEISYIHATGYPAGEMKHGPIALIDKNSPVVAIATQSSVYEKMLSNIEEVRSRGARIISIATEGDKRIKDISDEVFYIPPCGENVSPILVALPLQLLAYYSAVLNKRDVDRPRNLAKSVTVE